LLCRADFLSDRRLNRKFMKKQTQGYALLLSILLAAVIIAILAFSNKSWLTQLFGPSPTETRSIMTDVKVDLNDIESNTDKQNKEINNLINQ